MVEDVFVFLITDGRVDGNIHHAGQGHAHVHEVPFGPVVADGDDPVTLFQSHGHQSVGDRVRCVNILPGCVFFPLTINPGGEHILFLSVFLTNLVEDVECPCNFHHDLNISSKLGFLCQFFECQLNVNRKIY